MVDGQVDDVFVGRQIELARIGDVRARVEEGQPWLVTIEGESGIGKSALASQAVVRSAGSTVLRARCDAAESDLQYGVIDQLVRGVDRHLLRDRVLLTSMMATSSPFAVGAELLGGFGGSVGRRAGRDRH